MEKVKLQKEVFRHLIEDLQKTIREEAVGKISLKQLYGFGRKTEYDPVKPNLKKRIERKVPEVGKVNIKYLYDKSRELKHDSSQNFVILENYHTWIYFKFLNYNGPADYAEELHENGRITDRQFHEQQDLLKGRNQTKNGKGIFGCYHYSTLWHGLYAFEISIDYQSVRYDGEDLIYDVTSISAMNKEAQPIRSFGTARHKGSNLLIELEDRRDSGLKKLIFSVERGPDRIEAGVVFLGSYVGISRNSDIISGTACLMKVQNEEEVKDIPIEIQRYLYLDKWQKRIPLEPLGYQKHSIPFKRDKEDLLKYLVGTYRFCWLNSKGDRLIESFLEIESNYQLKIRSYMSTNGVYSGRIFIQNNVACFNSLGLRGDSVGVKLSSSVFLNIEHIPRHEEVEYIEGVYILAGVPRKPKYGVCLLEKLDGETFNPSESSDKEYQHFIPTIHKSKDVAETLHLSKILLTLQKLERKAVEDKDPSSTS